MGIRMIDKHEYFLAGKYICPVPDAPSHMWAIADWIKHIDRTGSWLA